MKVFDLNYVEDELIASIEHFLPQINVLKNELQLKAQSVAAVQAAREAAIKAGTAGLAKVTVKPTTRPISPNITKPRPPQFPEPEKISTKVINK